jgi:hypothetical protein
MLLGVGVAYCIWQPIGESLRDEVTVYPAAITSTGLVALNRSTFGVSRDTQTVIYWMPGFPLPPQKLHECTVRDRLNWQCEYPDKSATLTMVAGRFAVEPEVEPQLDEHPTIYISRLHWQYCKWTGQCRD